jgi:hypothetical protein
MATANMQNTIIAGLLIWVANLIGGFGIIICCVGIIFTFPYSAAIVAGIVTWYEQITSGPATGPGSMPPAPPAPPAPPPPAPLPQ